MSYRSPCAFLHLFTSVKNMIFSRRSYSLRKSRHILEAAYTLYQKKRARLNRDELTQFEFLLGALDQAVLKENREEAASLAVEVEEFNKSHFKKSIFEYCSEMVVAVAVALAIATIVRQSWFELYEIPTGSMRPTFEEQDRLTVTKTAFGINIPLATSHLYFDPNLVQRTSVVIWSGDGVPHLDSDSTFMGVFPYTKRYVKRCMGKPNDVLYFYGGRIYGLDQEGNELRELLDSQSIAKLEYLPFTSFSGRLNHVADPRSGTRPQVFFNHFNQAIGRIIFQRSAFRGEIFNGKEWVIDNPRAQQEAHTSLQTYSDFWGIRNFAEARLLNQEQLEKFTPFTNSEFEDAELFLELRHTPSLSYPDPLVSERLDVFLKGFSTIIPLQEKHLQALMKNMYTCRFVVQNGRAAPYRMEGTTFRTTSPSFANVPDGTYEFYYGQAVRLGWGAITSSLPHNHPLYSSEPSHIQKLFNVGIDMTTLVEPTQRNMPYFPNRYAYFRDGDLYLMGGKVLDKDDPILQSFNEREKKRQEKSTTAAPYVAFRDYGPPLKPDGRLDADFIRTFGLKIPSDHYLMLGDNHAMSQDSRYFGPIPEANLQGAPSLIIWPPGERWGVPNQRPYPLFTLPRLAIWGVVALIAFAWFLYCQRNKGKPIFKKL